MLGNKTEERKSTQMMGLQAPWGAAVVGHLLMISDPPGGPPKKTAAVHTVLAELSQVTTELTETT